MLKKFKKKGTESKKNEDSSSAQDIRNGSTSESGGRRPSRKQSKVKQKGRKHKGRREQANRDVAFDAKFLMGRLHNLGFMTQDGRKLDSQNSHAPWKVGRKYKMGNLIKQGGVIKSWHERCFVLREKGLFYFESLAAYRRDAMPFGQIFMHDIVCPTGDEPVSEVPVHLVRHIRRPHAFCIHTAVRTYVFAAESEGEKLSWMTAILEAFRNWQATLPQGENGESESASSESFDEQGQREEAERPSHPVSTLHSKKSKFTMDNMGIPTVGSKRVAKHYLALLEDDFESEVQELRKRYELQRLWAHWVVFAKISKRERRERRQSTIELF